MTIPVAMTMREPSEDEPAAVAERYARREARGGVGDLYSPLRPEVWQARQERQREMLALLARHALLPLHQLRVLEIGCGSGSNLLELASLGFDAARLVGNELSVRACRHRAAATARRDRVARGRCVEAFRRWKLRRGLPVDGVQLAPR